MSVCTRKILRPDVLTQLLFVLLCLQADTEMVPKFLKLLLPASHVALPDLNWSKLNIVAVKATIFFSKLRSSTLIQKIKIRRPLSQASWHLHFHAALIRRPNERAREPSNKIMLFLPLRNKLSVTPPMTFHFHLPFCYTFCMSLCLFLAWRD
jgi:hypothetical protein